LAEQISTVQPVEDPMLDQAPCRSCRPWIGAHERAGFLAGPVAHVGPTLGLSVPEGLYPVERTHAGAVLELQHMERTRIGESHEGLYPWERPHSGEKHEEGAAEMKHYGLIATPIPHPPMPLGVRR